MTDAYPRDLSGKGRTPPNPQRPGDAVIAVQLVVNYTLDANDMRFATARGFNSGDQSFAYLKDAFDVLFCEGLEGSPKVMSVDLADTPHSRGSWIMCFHTIGSGSRDGTTLPAPGARITRRPL